MTEKKSKNRPRSKNYIDITGQRFGRLTVIEDTGKREGGLVVWKCQCDCGNTCEVTGAMLRRGTTKSCGCLRREQVAIDLIGERFGKLTVVGKTDKRKKESVVWECECDCGNTCEVSTKALRSGQRRSCGCLVRQTVSKNLEGQRFGKLVALRPAGRKHGYVLWECACDCGNTRLVRTYDLTGGRVTSCGCAPRGVRPRDIAGERFGKLTAIEPTGRSEDGSAVWRCVCDCGREVEVPRRRLVGGARKNCRMC